jgi:hypothetical protein
MTQLLKLLPLFTILIAGPAFAEPDPHAGHHPAATTDAAKPAAPTAKVDAKSAMPACPMMAGSGAVAGKGLDGKKMMDHKDMHCMPAAAAAKDADAPHDHAHPDTAPK